MIDLYLTDPPYNVNYGARGKQYKEQGGYECGMEDRTIMNDNMSSEEFKEFLSKVFTLASEKMKKGASFYVWYASKEHVNFETSLVDAGLLVKQHLIWNKSSFTLGRQDYQWKHEPCLYGWKEGASHNWYSDRSQTTVMDFDKPKNNDLHPTMKPLDLIGYQISNSTKKGDKVLDTFGGSGSTLIACEQLERKCYAMELDEKYASVIVKRWEELTGEKAVKL